MPNANPLGNPVPNAISGCDLNLPGAVQDQGILQEGCYLIHCARLPGQQVGEHANPPHWGGTLRVQRSGGATITASGDLYEHPNDGSAEKDPAQGIPIFPLGKYVYYVALTGLVVADQDNFTLGFDLYRYQKNGLPAGSWTQETGLTAEMTRTRAPEGSGYPRPNEYFEGGVMNGTVHKATITMGWVDEHLRRAVVEVDRAAVSEFPGDEARWEAAFRAVGWRVAAERSQNNLREPNGGVWDVGTLHATMRAKRDPDVTLDTEWRYHLICGRFLTDANTGLSGIMYDESSGDKNHVAREGCALFSHWTFPFDARFSQVAGRRFGSVGEAYFHIGLHEVGHAMGLLHDEDGCSIMATTETAANHTVPPNSFPSDLPTSHNLLDQRRLRHLPDPFVRPGGISFGACGFSLPFNANQPVGRPLVTLTVEPVLGTLPFGAPVRINFTLANTSDKPVGVPSMLGLKMGFVQGKVFGSSEEPRTFRPVVRCLNGYVPELQPGELVEGSAILLRGPEGPLFPNAGPYRIQIEVDFAADGEKRRVTGETQVEVTPCEDPDQLKAAQDVMESSDAFLSLVLGGDHLTEGRVRLEGARKNKVLHRHYASAEAIRLAHYVFDRGPDYKLAAALLEEGCVRSKAENRQILEMFERAPDEEMETKLRVKLVCGTVVPAPAPVPSAETHVDLLSSAR